MPAPPRPRIAAATARRSKRNERALKRTTPKPRRDRADRTVGAAAGEDRLVRAERELAALRVECAHMHRLSMLGTLAGAVAHEFNNLLTPMSSFAQMAQSHPEDETLRNKALAKVVEGTEQLAEIAASLLGMARRDESTNQASVLECVNDALMCLARPPSKNRVRLDVDVDPRLVAAIRPVLLRQVILNLILNAMKAMRPDGGSLIIRARRAGSNGSGGGTMGEPGRIGKCSTWNTPEGDRDDDADAGQGGRGGAKGTGTLSGPGAGFIEIDVQDTGPGVPRWMANKVFDPFVTSAGGGGAEREYAAARRRSSDHEDAESEPGANGRGGACAYAGTGLGLSICAWLVGDAGGTIRHEEPATGGARFVVTLRVGGVGG